MAEEAYFHHELGVLAICAGNLERARAELEASIGMRGALADKRGTVAGRRALALVADLSGEHAVPAALRAESPSPRRAAPRPPAPPPSRPRSPSRSRCPADPCGARPSFPGFSGLADKGPAPATRPVPVPVPGTAVPASAPASSTAPAATSSPSARARSSSPSSAPS